MKITKRELYKIIKEEIQGTLGEVLNEKELEEMGQTPFDGAGYVGESPVDSQPVNEPQASAEYQALEAQLRKVLADQTLGPAVRQMKVREISAQLKELA